MNYSTVAIQQKIDEVESLVDYARRNRLEGVDFLDQFSLEEIVSMWNGIGPEFLPSWVRGLADHLYSCFRPACLIHDVMFARMGDRTRLGFNTANLILRRNLLKTADIEYGWYNPRRYRRRLSARRLADACSAFGWPAWEAAGEGLTESEHLAMMENTGNA